MRLLIAALLAIFPAAAGAAALQGPEHSGQPARATANCARTTPYDANGDGQPLNPHKLIELPPAHAFSAVYRQINGCEVPILIKYRISGR